jgi:hypothetical protein
MTKKEKEIMNITLWKMALLYTRKSQNEKFKANEEYSKGWLDAYYSAMVSLAMTLHVDLTQLLIDVEEGKYFVDIEINSHI